MSSSRAATTAGGWARRALAASAAAFVVVATLPKHAQADEPAPPDATVEVTVLVDDVPDNSSPPEDSGPATSESSPTEDSSVPETDDPAAEADNAVPDEESEPEVNPEAAAESQAPSATVPGDPLVGETGTTAGPASATTLGSADGSPVLWDGSPDDLQPAALGAPTWLPPRPPDIRDPRLSVFRYVSPNRPALGTWGAPGPLTAHNDYREVLVAGGNVRFDVVPPATITPAGVTFRPQEAVMAALAPTNPQGVLGTFIQGICSMASTTQSIQELRMLFDDKCGEIAVSVRGNTENYAFDAGNARATLVSRSELRIGGANMIVQAFRANVSQLVPDFRSAITVRRVVGTLSEDAEPASWMSAMPLWFLLDPHVTSSEVHVYGGLEPFGLGLSYGQGGITPLPPAATYTANGVTVPRDGGWLHIAPRYPMAGIEPKPNPKERLSVNGGTQRDLGRTQVPIGDFPRFLDLSSYAAPTPNAQVSYEMTSDPFHTISPDRGFDWTYRYTRIGAGLGACAVQDEGCGGPARPGSGVRVTMATANGGWTKTTAQYVLRLPPGLRLANAAGGQQAAAGTYVFPAGAVDAGQYLSRNIDLVVAPGAPSGAYPIQLDVVDADGNIATVQVLVWVTGIAALPPVEVPSPGRTVVTEPVAAPGNLPAPTPEVAAEPVAEVSAAIPAVTTTPVKREKGTRVEAAAAVLSSLSAHRSSTGSVGAGTVVIAIAGLAAALVGMQAIWLSVLWRRRSGSGDDAHPEVGDWDDDGLAPSG